MDPSPPDHLPHPLVVLDTNIFVAAGFRPRSASGRIVAAVRAGELTLVWNEPTLREIERILRKIPRLAWSGVSSLFTPDHYFAEPTHPERFGSIADPADRKFAALAAAAGATLVTLDRHLLDVRAEIGAAVMTAGEYEAGRREKGEGRR